MDLDYRDMHCNICNSCCFYTEYNVAMTKVNIDIRELKDL